MKLIVVGCGRLGSELAFRLYQQNNDVTIVDKADSAFENLDSDFNGRTILGDILDRSVLERAGIEDAHGLAAVTSSDAINAVVAHIAKSYYKVPYVVSRNFHPKYRPMHEAFGLQVVCSTSWGAQRIEEMLYHGHMHTVFSAGNGEVEVYEILIPEEWDGKQLGDLLPEQGCVPISLARAGKAEIATADSVLRAGDYIHIGATMQGATRLRKRMDRKQEG